MTTDELREIIDYGREQQHVEFKAASSRSDKPSFAKVTRAALALSNLRDGGYIVIGVTESKHNSPEVTGLGGVPKAGISQDKSPNKPSEQTLKNFALVFQIL